MKQFFVNTWATILRVGTALIAVFRGAGQGMTVLAVMMIADYITGVLRAALGKSDKTSGLSRPAEKKPDAPGRAAVRPAG